MEREGVVGWPVSASRTVYANRWITVREDTVTRPDGESGVYGVVTVRQPSVFVVALTDVDEVLLVDVDRHTVGRSLEVPAGGTDGEEPLVAAQRELAEEAGVTASSWEEIGRMQALNGICEAPEVVFLARGLTAITTTAQAEEGIQGVHRVPWTEALAMVADGRITDGETVAALMYAALARGLVR